jgi:hypothetical protein
MKHIATIAVAAAGVAALCCLTLCSGCEKIFGEKGYEYQILKSGNPDGLVFMLTGNTDSDIVGVDTTTFTVEAWVRMKNMSIGGVAKLPQGGIAFTHHRRISDNAWGETLYVTDKSYNIIGKYPICPSPMAPRVIGSTLLVGSSGLDENIKHKFQVLDAETFQLKKEFHFEDMEDAWEISAYENYAYFDVCVDMPFTSSSYVVELNLGTLKTTEFYNNTSFFKEAAFNTCRKDSLLYVVNLLQKNLCLINLNSHAIGNVVEVSRYPQVATVDAIHLLAPRVVGEYLYAFLGNWNEEGNYTCYRLKLNANTFAFEDVKKITLPEGNTTGAYQSFVGRFWVVGVSDNSTGHVVFIDVECGEIANTATFTL